MKTISKSQIHMIVLAMLVILVFLPGMTTNRDFWVEDEARYAEVLREMKLTNQWWVPQLNGHDYPDKPPLYFWMVGFVTIFTGGITPIAFLVVNMFSTLGLVWVTYRFGKELKDATSGFLSALILLSSLLFLAVAQILRMDILFSFFILLALYCFWKGYQNNDNFFNKKKPNWWYVGCYLFSALAVLTKGPFGLVFVFLPILLFLLLQKQGEKQEIWRFLRNPGLLVFFGLVVGWLVSVVLSGHGAFVENIFSKQIVARTISSFQHKEPFYYYLWVLPLGFLPWIVFLPRIIKKTWPEVKGVIKARGVKGVKGGTGESRHILLLWLWVGTGLLVLSMVSCKIVIYLLPLFPALALLTGLCLGGCPGIAKNNEIPNKSGYKKLTKSYKKFPGGRRGEPSVHPLFLENHLGDLQEKVRQKPGRIKGILAGIIGGTLISVTALMFFGAEWIHEHFSPRTIGEEIRGFGEQGYQVATYRVTRGILNFYSGMTFTELTRENLDSFFDSPGKEKTLLVTKARYLEFIKKRTKIKIKEGKEEDVMEPEEFLLNNEKYLFLFF